MLYSPYSSLQKLYASSGGVQRGQQGVFTQQPFSEEAQYAQASLQKQVPLQAQVQVQRSPVDALQAQLAAVTQERDALKRDVRRLATAGDSNSSSAPYLRHLQQMEVPGNHQRTASDSASSPGRTGIETLTLLSLE